MKIKLNILLLVFFIVSHLAFKSTVSYVFKNDKKIIVTRVSEQEYYSLLNADEFNIVDVIKNTEIQYLYLFPEKSILIIYLGYLITISGLILNVNFRKSETKN